MKKMGKLCSIAVDLLRRAAMRPERCSLLKHCLSTTMAWQIIWREGSGDLREAVGYASSQAHASVSSAFRLAGVPVANLRKVECDQELRLRPDELLRRIREDRAAGLRPFMIVATAGSTNTGAIDPLPEIADIAEAEKLWLHIDGAYGGAFVLCPEGQQMLQGLARAQSITFDPHKGLFLPYGTGCLLLRDRSDLRRPEDEDAPYLRGLQGAKDETRYGPSDFGLELTRPFRGLRLWLPLMLHGAEAFRQALSEKLALAKRLLKGLEELKQAGGPIEIAAPCELTVVAFRLTRIAGESLDRWNARNAAFLEALNRSGAVILSGTKVPSDAEELFTLRACVLSYRTHGSDIDALLEGIASALSNFDHHEAG
jgi:aromatic-L-amino-acid decarboxylase